MASGSAGRVLLLTLAGVAVTAASSSAAPQNLTITLAGTGTGTVTSSPAGIDCGSDCSESYPALTQVTLTATPTLETSTFDGWSGNADCIDGIVGMNTSKTCIATFSLIERSLTVTNDTGDSTGGVVSTPAGIDCGADCNHTDVHGTTVDLDVTPAAFTNFTGWTGDCSGTDDPLTVTMDADKTCHAVFDLMRRDLTVATAGNGGGSVTSSPAGIDCGSECAADYGHGTDVTLTRASAAGRATRTAATGSST
jgi:uncharacterized repeat protein (TIGR02543 family)